MSFREFVDTFSTREQIVFLGLSIFITCVILILIAKNFRNIIVLLSAPLNILKAINLSFGITLLAGTIYILIILNIIKSSKYWSVQLTDEIIIFLFVAGSMFFKFTTKDEANFFKRSLQLVGYTVVFVSILDQYTFSYTIEILLVSFMTTYTIFFKDSTNKNRVYLDFLVCLIAFPLIAYCIFLFLKDIFQHNTLAITEIILSFLLPIAFLPFLYYIFIYDAFLTLFRVIDRKLKNDSYRFRFKIGLLLHTKLRKRLITRVLRNQNTVDFQNLPPINAAKFLTVIDDFDLPLDTWSVKKKKKN